MKFPIQELPQAPFALSLSKGALAAVHGSTGSPRTARSASHAANAESCS
jgi:hypothetical protein